MDDDLSFSEKKHPEGNSFPAPSGNGARTAPPSEQELFVATLKEKIKAGEEPPLEEVVLWALSYLEKGQTRRRAEQNLKHHGVPDALAANAARRAAWTVANRKRLASFAQVVFGLFAIALAVGGAWLSYEWASPGGVYVIPTGFFICGGWLVAQGLYGMLMGEFNENNTIDV